MERVEKRKQNYFILYQKGEIKAFVEFEIGQKLIEQKKNQFDIG